MISDNDDLIPMIEGLRAGDAQAAQLFCARFGPALIRVADRRLPGVVRRRVDPEDVVQSACRTFLRRARGGEFTLADSEGLWRLLCAITLTKVHEQTRFQLQKKRNAGQEIERAPANSDESVARLDPVDRNPDPAQAAAFADQFEQLLQSLDPEERQIVDLKLQQFTNDQVAEQMNCLSRTVTRLLKRVQSRLSKVFETT